MRTLTLLPAVQTEEEAIVAAYTILAAAYRDALAVPGLPDEDRAGLLRQLRCCEQLARRSPLAVVGGDA